MLARVRSCAVLGIDGVPLDIEVDNFDVFSVLVAFIRYLTC